MKNRHGNKLTDRLIRQGADSKTVQTVKRAGGGS